MIALPLLPRRLAAAGLLAAAFAALPAAAQQSREIGLDPVAARYELGQGLALGHGLRLGGYGVASYAEPDGGRAGRAALDALSGFLWWDDGARWRFFSEVELEEALLVRDGEATLDEVYLGLERFYFDYAHTDAIKLRAGKFLTPVGRWNLIHAAPLVWTTSRPLITEATFPTNATGLMLYGLLPGAADGVEYSVYVSPGEELLPNPDVDTFNEAYGAHLSFSPLTRLRLGVSAVSFELDGSPDERRRLWGADFAWARARWELSGEFAYRVTSEHLEDRDEQGLFLQAVAPLGARLYAVARYENFRAAGSHGDLNLYLGGLNLRLRPALVLKAEYSQATDNEAGVRDGFRASVAVLF